MRVWNWMFGKGLGGLEQAALDYHEALKLAGHEVTSWLHRNAAMNHAFDAADFTTRHCAPRGEWDVFALLSLRRAIRQSPPDAIIAHGNRAIGLALRAAKGRVPVIGVAHNYQIQKRFPKCDAVFCITRDLIEELVHLEMPRERLFHIPNLIRTPAPPAPRSALHQPLRIGALGRFVEKKGMDVLIDALAQLRDEGIAFEATIGGDGKLAPLLIEQIHAHGLQDQIALPGWISDKAAFFASLDVFVLPSHHEPFGIVLIEAMAAGLACITTDTEGPCEIIRDRVDAIMVERNHPFRIARAIAELHDAPETALAMGQAAYLTVKNRYDLAVVSRQLDASLRQCLPLASAA